MGMNDAGRHARCFNCGLWMTLDDRDAPAARGKMFGDRRAGESGADNERFLFWPLRCRRRRMFARLARCKTRAEHGALTAESRAFLDRKTGVSQRIAY